MPIIIVDGPEKAGKSTFIAELVRQLGPNTRVRHHSAVNPVAGKFLDQRYEQELREDLARPSKYTVYDRCWASDHVYDRFFNRATSRLKNTGFLGEWLYTRAVATTGASVMLLGPSDSHLYAMRTAEDHPISPHIERAAFETYGEVYHWDFVRRQPHGAPYTTILATQVIELVKRRALEMMALRMGPPTYVGSAHPRVLFVGDVDTQSAYMPGGFLPFTSEASVKFAESLGPLAMHCGWAFSLTVTDELLQRARLVITCGKGARDRVAEFKARGRGSTQVMDIHNPTWLYRWGQAAGLTAPTEVRVRRAVYKYLGLQEVA